MSKTVIINENMMRKLVENQLITENSLTKTEVANIVKDTIKNDSQIKKEMEKKVKY